MPVLSTALTEVSTAPLKDVALKAVRLGRRIDNPLQKADPPTGLSSLVAGRNLLKDVPKTAPALAIQPGSSGFNSLAIAKRAGKTEPSHQPALAGNSSALPRRLPVDVPGVGELANAGNQAEDSLSPSLPAADLAARLSASLKKFKEQPESIIPGSLAVGAVPRKHFFCPGPVCVVTPVMQQYRALCDLLIGTGVLSTEPANPEQLLDTVRKVMRVGCFPLLSEVQKADIAIAFGNALPELGQHMAPGKRQKLDHRAVTEFNAMISGSTVYSENDDDSTPLAPLPPAQRSRVIAAVAPGLPNLPAAVRNGPIEGGPLMAAFVDRDAAIVPWRPSLQVCLLTHMLKALEQGMQGRGRGTQGHEMSAALDNAGAWTALLQVAPVLQGESEKKIYAGFLGQIRNSGILATVSADEFNPVRQGFKEWRPAMTVDADDLDTCRRSFEMAFLIIEQALPGMEDSRLVSGLETSLKQFFDLLPPAARATGST